MTRSEGANRARRFLLRVGAMAAKEALHVRRDPRTLLLGLVMPVVMLLLFGYGVSFDLDHVPLAVADLDHSPASRELTRAFLEPGEFALALRADAGEAEPIFRRREALALLAIPAGYGRDLARGEPGRAQLLVDGSDAVTANQVMVKAEAIALAVSQRRAAAQGLSGAPPLTVSVWTRYNPEGRSALFIVPGLAAYLMAIAAVLLTALAVASEWERGSMEQLFASPVGRLDIILGKLLPYLALGMAQLLLVLGVGTAVFDVPVRGSPWVILFMGFLFLLGMLGQGLLISVLSKSQLVATQAGALSSLLPSLLLSGMLVPIENMPAALQVLSRIIPARYLVHALRAAMLKGTGLSGLWADALAMALFAVAVLGIATARFKRRVA